MFRQAGLRIQALQIDMDDPTLLCTTERARIDSKKYQIKRFRGIEEEWGERRKFLRRSGNGA